MVLQNHSTWAGSSLLSSGDLFHIDWVSFRNDIVFDKKVAKKSFYQRNGSQGSFIK